ncbi:CD225/dispanin family protein [Pontiella sp.]|uniref:CD225/dispanin family protein n=1 Tax=Pontiella sp. TaxID=2837462 RepID=UPI00356A48B7
MSEEKANIPNYLWQSIVVTILCCLPVGIPAIIFASKVNGLVIAGQIEEAKAASDKAKMWCWISFGLGIVSSIIGVVVQLGMFGAMAAGSY